MEWLKKAYLKHPGKKFINELTYKDVYENTVSLARRVNFYVENEKRVALYASNSKEMIILIFALLLLKKEVLLLNIHLTEKEIKKQTDELGVHIIFSDCGNFLPMDKIHQRAEADVAISWEMKNEDIAIIMNTSATTGKFKSVPIRWKQIKAHVKASAEALGVKEDDHWLITLPLFHISGLSILFRSLYNGTRVTILHKFEEKKVLELICNYEINMISLVPTMLKKIYKDIKRHNLRMILLGGEFIPNRLITECIRLKLPIYKTYGMTETTSQITTFSVLAFPQKTASVGTPLSGVKVSIRNKDSSGIGEIWIKSPMLMRGYIGMEKIHGYFNTNDTGHLDQDGFLYILNRRNDIIISGGENIYPKEIEDLLYELADVTECAVVSESDDLWGQSPVLYVVSSAAEETIRAYLMNNLAKYKVPKKIVFMDSLPKNYSGKIMRSILTGVNDLEN